MEHLGLSMAGRKNDIRIHDLRQSYASAAAAFAQDLRMIGKPFGRTQVRTTARYAHLETDPIKIAADVVFHQIAAAYTKRLNLAYRPSPRDL